MSIIKVKTCPLRNQRGNAVIMGGVAVTLLAVSAVMLIQGYLSTLKFKSRVENKASLTSVKDGILDAFSVANLYQSNTSLDTAIQNGITIPQAGTITTYNSVEAFKLVGKLATHSAEQTTKALCDKGSQIPTKSTDNAEFIFCFSNVTGNAKTISSSVNSFFGSAAFGLIKVILKRSSATHVQFITEIPQWSQFKTDANPTVNFQADISYTFVWGKENEPSSIFVSSGNVLRDLK